MINHFMGKRLPIVSAILLLISLQTIGKPIDDLTTTVTRNLDNSPLPTRADYLAQFPERELSIQLIDPAGPDRDPEGTVVVVINTSLYNRLTEELDLYMDDLRSEGYEVRRLVSEGGTPEELKEVMIESGGDEMVGTVHIGEQPLAWFEQYEHFYNEDEPDHQRIIEFPIDLFYMDIDGIWEDTSGNEIYDFHGENWEPDIWFGRLPGYNLSRIDEDTLMTSYFNRVHLYRNGEVTLPHRSLNFIDDDWQLQLYDWTNDMGMAYGNILAEADPETTSATVYRNRLLNEDGFEFVQVAVHSTADAHLFHIDQRSNYDYFRFRHLREEVPPNVMFYNLFACSNMNLSRNLCMGALYALRGPYGLGSVGSAKTGSMLYFEDYYRHLDDGVCMGEALRRWFVQHGHEPGHENWARSWFYGMTHFGDPTLTIPRGLKVIETFADDSQGDNDSVIDAGESINLSLRIENRREAEFNSIEVSILSEDPFLEVMEDHAFIEQIEGNQNQECSGFQLEVAPDCPDGHLALVTCIMQPADEEEWWSRILLPIRSPRLAAVGYGISEIEGDGDLQVEPGETGVISVQFFNLGGDDMRTPGEVIFTSLDSLLESVAESAELPAIPQNSFRYSSNFQFDVSIDAISAPAIFVRTEVTDGESSFDGGVFALPIMTDFTLADSFMTEPIWINHYPVTDGYADVWRWGENDGDSTGGIAFGGPDTLDYPARADAAFELPLLMLDDDATLRFRHRMDVELMYDAGIVEIDRGQGWQRAIPDGGYNGESVGNGSYEGGECWNGTFDWTDVSVSVGESPGPLRIRFRFASDGGVEGDGWYIDRISLSGTPLEVRPGDGVPREFGIRRLFPNPFNGQFRMDYVLPSSGLTTITLFDVTGRETAILNKGHRPAGYGSVEFNVRSPGSGVYFVVLESDGKTDTQKLIYLK